MRQVLSRERPPPEARLRFYASQFNLVEVDTSYYAIPSVTTAQHWAERTPAGFVFNVKAFSLFTGHWTSTDVLPKDIQQALGAGRRMVYKDMDVQLREELWKRFAACLVPLQVNAKLGLVHFQFSPKVSRHKASIEHIEHCLQHLPGHTLSIEFRHPSWWENSAATADTLAMLRSLGLVHTIVDGPQGTPHSVPAILETTHPDHALLRLHGRNEPPRVLRRLQLLRRWSHEQVTEVLPGGARARRAHGAGAPSRLPVAVGRH